MEIPEDIQYIILSKTDYETLTYYSSTSKLANNIFNHRILHIDLIVKNLPEVLEEELRIILSKVSIEDLKTMSKSCSETYIEQSREKSREKYKRRGGMSDTRIFFFSIKDKIDFNTYSKLFSLLKAEEYIQITTSFPETFSNELQIEALFFAEYGDVRAFELIWDKISDEMIDYILLSSLYYNTELFLYFLDNGYFKDIDNIPQYYNQCCDSGNYRHIFSFLANCRNIKRPKDEILIYMIVNGLLTVDNIRPPFSYLYTSINEFQRLAEFENMLNTLLKYEEIQNIYFDLYPNTYRQFVRYITEEAKRVCKDIGWYIYQYYFNMLDDITITSYIKRLNRKHINDLLRYQKPKNVKILIENGFIPNDNDIISSLSSSGLAFITLKQNFDIDLESYRDLVKEKLLEERFFSDIFKGELYPLFFSDYLIIYYYFEDLLSKEKIRIYLNISLKKILKEKTKRFDCSELLSLFGEHKENDNEGVKYIYKLLKKRVKYNMV